MKSFFYIFRNEIILRQNAQRSITLRKEDLQPTALSYFFSLPSFLSSVCFFFCSLSCFCTRGFLSCYHYDLIGLVFHGAYSM